MNERTRIIRNKELAEMLSVSKVTIFRWERDGLLPPRIKLGERAVGWKAGDIYDWLNRKAITDKETVAVLSVNEDVKKAMLEICDKYWVEKTRAYFNSEDFDFAQCWDEDLEPLFNKYFKIEYLKSGKEDEE